MTPQIHTLTIVEYLELVLQAAKDERLTILNREHNQDFQGKESHEIRFIIKDGLLSNVAALIQECRSIDLRESLKVAAQARK